MKRLVEAGEGRAGRWRASLTEIIGLRPEVVMALGDTPIDAEATDVLARTMGREADALSAVISRSSREL
jgi:hypothetical protein